MAIIEKSKVNCDPPEGWPVIGVNAVAELHRAIERGDIRIELCGHLEHADGIKGFTLNKTKYQLRMVDETEESVRVIIEPLCTSAI